MAGAPRDAELRREIEGREWYHTLELAPGVLTPGWFDLRPVAARILPASLAGMRCLDVGTFDGFWAFEMERRGADEVVAIDVIDPRRWDWPVNSTEAAVAALAARKREGVGFELARAALGSAVERRELSVHELSPGLVGSFDLVYIGSLLLHLRDPVGGLEAAASVCDGRLIAVDAIDLVKTLLFRRQPVAALDGLGRPWWWKPNLAGLTRMVEAAGLEPIEPPRRIAMPAGPGHPRPGLAALRSAAGREQLLAARRGDPHGVVVARRSR